MGTEEEFEWGKGFRRDRTSVEAMRGVPRFQRLFEEFGFTPARVAAAVRRTVARTA